MATLKKKLRAVNGVCRGEHLRYNTSVDKNVPRIIEENVKKNSEENLQRLTWMLSQELARIKSRTIYVRQVSSELTNLVQAGAVPELLQRSIKKELNEDRTQSKIVRSPHALE